MAEEEEQTLLARERIPEEDVSRITELEKRETWDRAISVGTIKDIFECTYRYEEKDEDVSTGWFRADFDTQYNHREKLFRTCDVYKSVKQLTGPQKCTFSSYATACFPSTSQAEITGTHDYFVSYSWSQSLHRLVEVLKWYIEYAEQEGLTSAFEISYDKKLWLDIMCINQNGETTMHDLANLPECIQKSKYGTIISMGTRGQPLTRIWCIYEIWHSILKKKPLNILLGIKVTNGANIRGYALLILCGLYDRVDIAKAQATKEADLNMIHGLINDSGVTFDEINGALREALQNTARDLLLPTFKNDQEKLNELVAYLSPYVQEMLDKWYPDYFSLFIDPEKGEERGDPLSSTSLYFDIWRKAAMRKVGTRVFLRIADSGYKFHGNDKYWKKYWEEPVGPKEGTVRLRTPGAGLDEFPKDTPIVDLNQQVYEEEPSDVDEVKEDDAPVVAPVDSSPNNCCSLL